MNEIKELLDPFEPITLQEMDRVKLMNRMDTKFAFRFSDLNTLLPLLTLNYRVLTIETKSVTGPKI